MTSLFEIGHHHHRWAPLVATLSVPHRSEDMATVAAAATTTHASSSVAPIVQLFNYHQDPDSFVTSLVDECIQTTNQSSVICHLYYWHIGKTGGTTLETTFWSDSVFGPPPYETMRDTCCNKPLEERVQEHWEDYCNARFVSLQVSGKAFFEFVRQCQQYHHHNYSSHQQAPRHEIRVLVSYREPSHLTLSTIHQYCNKHLIQTRRSPQLLAACQHCQYESDAPYWDYIVQEINLIYTDLYQLVVFPLPQQTPHDGDHPDSSIRSSPFQVLYAIELPDMNDFTQRLYGRLAIQDSGNHDHHHANPEKTLHCSFGMTSPMFKGLEPSRLVYRQLVSMMTMTNQMSSPSSTATRTSL
jgi:hypothetical protein